MDIYNIHFHRCDELSPHLTHLLEKMMETVKSLNDKLDTLAADTANERTEWLAAVADFKAQIQALKDQIAAGAVVTQADLDALGARLDTQAVSTQAIVDKADV